jgi:hypothetical protein
MVQIRLSNRRWAFHIASKHVLRRHAPWCGSRQPLNTLISMPYQHQETTAEDFLVRLCPAGQELQRDAKVEQL